MDRVLPSFIVTSLIYGAKDEFKKLGAKGFTQKILGEKRLSITATSMRAAQQSQIATRMRTKDIVGAAKASNAIFQNAYSVEARGGATYATAYRYLKESPWKRLEILSERMPNTLIQSGNGYSAACINPNVNDDDKVIITTVLNALGQTMNVTENKFETFTAFCCTGPN